MNAYIFTGGDVLLENINIELEDGDIVIAADSGYDKAKALSIHPDIIIGDMDSVKGDFRQEKDAQIIILPKEKDLTDTEAAVKLAIEKGALSIAIIGGIGSRTDHTLSALAILEYIESLYSAPTGKRRKFFGYQKQLRMQKKISAYITNGANRVRFLHSDSTIIPKEPCFKYLSVITLDEYAKGVTINGCKYPLINGTLERKHQYAVSNEIEGNCAFVSVRKGAIYIIESFKDN